MLHQARLLLAAAAKRTLERLARAGEGFFFSNFWQQREIKSSVVAFRGRHEQGNQELKAVIRV